jgi:hypothetical protein
MSTFFLADRVKELSRTTGTGSIVLDGAVSSFSGFGDFYASGDVVFYAMTDGVQYEIGSGIYEKSGSDRVLTRNPFRSSTINSGPYFLNGSSDSGPTAGTSGYFYPLYLTRSAAISGVGYTDGPYAGVMEHTFSGDPGTTFYMPTDHQGHATQLHGGVSGTDYETARSPISWTTGLKEVFVTYPGKTSVYNGYGLDGDISEPKHSGLAFWRNEQIINHTDDMVWDDVNNRLGISQTAPQYALDIGGERAYSIIRVSGIVEGGSGIMFSGGQLTHTGATASGGKQLEPFLRNELGNASNGVIELSGIVDQYIGLAKQTPGTVFAGPTVNHCGTPPCSPDDPSFRLLNIDDIPLAALTTSGNFVLQKNVGLDGQTANITPNNFTLGMVAIYAGSGSVTYDSGILFDYNNNRLLVGGDASTDSPNYNLDARGTLGSQSGYFNQLIFTDGLIRIGTQAGTDEGNSTENYHLVGVGDYAGFGVSGISDGVLIGHFAGFNSQLMSGVVIAGLHAGDGGYDIDDSVGVGTQALAFATGVAASQVLGSGAGSGLLDSSSVSAIGVGVAQGASGLANVIAVGTDSANGASVLTNVVAVDLRSTYNSSNLTDVFAAGRDSASESAGLTNCYLIGVQSASGSAALQELIGLGSSVAREASGVQNSVALGNKTLMYASGIDQSNFIGERAGRSGLNLIDVVGIGTDAAESASGTNNIYIGNNAGVAVSGNENIEIIGSGAAASFLGTEASGKINIGNTIVGDIYGGKVGFGNPSDASPGATVFVTPKENDDAAFIVRHPASGSSTPYMQLQSGDATTFYHITNSGDVITSGCMNPSGGLLLEAITPADWMNTTTNRLYNDAGTLKFNGVAVSVGGGFSSFDLRSQIDDTADSGVEITTGQTVLFSGIHVDTQIDSGNRHIIVDAGNLSGVLQNQITASNFQFYSMASGVDAGNNSLKLMEKDSVIAFSGVSGIHIDFTDLTDGTNSSGLYSIGYDPSSNYTFNVTNGDVADDIITSTETVTISGVSGVRAEYDAASNTFRIGASGLSGVLQAGIDTNTGFLSNENGPISVSGVSGIAAYASGQVDLITLGGATSGLIQQNSNYIMDPAGSGSLSRLGISNGGFVTFSGSSPIVINKGLSIGYSGGPGSVIIGENIANVAANDSSSTNSGIVAIGSYVLTEPLADQEQWAGIVAIGDLAMSGVGSHANLSIGLGYKSLVHCSGSANIGIGVGAGHQRSYLTANQGRRTVNNISIGTWAGLYQDGAVDGYDISMGYYAGSHHHSGVDNINIGKYAGGKWIEDNNFSNEHMVNIGEYAGVGSTGVKYSVNLGASAGYFTEDGLGNVYIGYQSQYNTSGQYNGTAHCVGIGYQVLKEGQDMDYTVAIGYRAGLGASGTYNNILMGRQAGQNRSGSDSIILNSKFLTGYSADWSDADEDYVLDVGEAIQGVMNPVNLHVGAKLNNTYRTISDILLATVNITPDSTTDSALLLNLHSSDGIVSSQAAGLLKTQTLSATTSLNSATNEIVNEKGWLRFPHAVTLAATSYPNTTLVNSAGDIIPVGEGVVATYDFGTDRGLAICILQAGAYHWHKIPTTTLM